MITDRRLLLLSTRFNPSLSIASVSAPLNMVKARKDRAFGNRLARGFLVMKFKNKLVFHVGGREIAYMSNIGHFPPPLSLL